jgi:TonB family protein
LVYFFVLSLSLHATALVYPVSFGGRSPAENIQVKILPIAQETAGRSGGQRENGSPARRDNAKLHRAMPSAEEPIVESKSAANPETETLSAETVATVSDNSIALVSEVVKSPEAPGAAISGPVGNNAIGFGNGLGGTGNGFGSSGTGRGRSSGSGNGSGSSGTGTVLTQARYQDTPRPDYPESARREGREGQVVLRVLVDDQGRSKEVEINRSSGNDALDRAAVDAIRRWRFHPARYGDRRIETWVQIPIVFRLADLKD